MSHKRTSGEINLQEILLQNTMKGNLLTGYFTARGDKHVK